MKRLQIMIEKELDAALERMALDEKTSKAALIRRFVRERLNPPIEDDPLYDLVGIADIDPAHHDDVVYPR